jgi:hypothetical protein
MLVSPGTSEMAYSTAWYQASILPKYCLGINRIQADVYQDNA